MLVEDKRQLTNVFKSHFTFAIALTAAQHCVKSTPTAVVPYLMATALVIVALRFTAVHFDPRGPMAMLNNEAATVATQVMSSLLGTWITSMVGDDASADKLLAAATLGLVMVWIASRSLDMH